MKKALELRHRPHLLVPEPDESPIFHAFKISEIWSEKPLKLKNGQIPILHCQTRLKIILACIWGLPATPMLLFFINFNHLCFCEHEREANNKLITKGNIYLWTHKCTVLFTFILFFSFELHIYSMSFSQVCECSHSSSKLQFLPLQPPLNVFSQFMGWQTELHDKNISLYFLFN